MRKMLLLALVSLLAVLAACGDRAASKEEEIEEFEAFQDDVEELDLSTDFALMSYLELVDERESAVAQELLEEKGLPLLEELIEEYEKLDFSYDVLEDFTDSMIDSLVYRLQTQELVLQQFKAIETGDGASDDADVIDELIEYERQSIDARVKMFDIAEEHEEIEAIQYASANPVGPLTEEDEPVYVEMYEKLFSYYEEGLDC